MPSSDVDAPWVLGAAALSGHLYTRHWLQMYKTQIEALLVVVRYLTEDLTVVGDMLVSLVQIVNGNFRMSVETGNGIERV